MSEERARKYMTLAEEARQAAERTTQAELKETYLRLAKSWIALAEGAKMSGMGTSADRHDRKHTT